MLAAGIIVKSTSEWSSPVVMQRKANRTYRFCIDDRKLNAVTRASAYPLPHMDAILRKLQDARYISTIDLSSAYHQIPLRKVAQALTAFTVPGMGLFEFTRMPYGVVGGPATFQNLQNLMHSPIWMILLSSRRRSRNTSSGSATFSGALKTQASRLTVRKASFAATRSSFSGCWLTETALSLTRTRLILFWITRRRRTSNS